MIKDIKELLIVVVVMIGALFLLYRMGYADGKAEVEKLWDADQAKLMQANGELIQQHAIEMQQEREKNLQTNKDNERDHKLALQAKDADLIAARADAARRGGLRIPATCPAGGGTGTAAETQGTGQRDGTVTVSVELPQRTQDDLWNLVSRADAIVEQARACQNWIRENGFSDEKPVDGLAPSQ